MVNLGPKPLIEEHYYIKELIDAQEKRSNDRTYYKDKAKALEERQKLIEDARMLVATDFHCSHCRQDFKQNAVLQVELDWSCLTQSIAFYKGKHKTCGEWSIRFVTDKQKDGFFLRSRAVRIEQGKYHNDLIQPHETGFNLLYGKKKFNN